VSDNTAAEDPEVMCACGHPWTTHKESPPFSCFGGGRTRKSWCRCTAPRPEAVGVVVNKAALDALREAVKGCGEMHYDVGTVGHPCGSRTYSLSGCERIRLCAPCSAKRDAAMARLLGSEIEGDSNGR